MSDKWFYQHAGAVHGPISAEQLLDLVDTGGLHRDDLIWPECIDAVAALPAEAALKFSFPGPGGRGLATGTDARARLAAPNWPPPSPQCATIDAAAAAAPRLAAGHPPYGTTGSTL